MMSGIRNSPPISMSSPRETRTGLPLASAASASRSAAAQLLTTSAASAPVSAVSSVSARLAAPAPAPERGRPRGRRRPAARAAARAARSGSGARPRFVCSRTPVALMTGVRPFAARDARPRARASSTSSARRVPPSAAAARTSASTSASIRFSRGRPSVEAALARGVGAQERIDRGDLPAHVDGHRAGSLSLAVARPSRPWSRVGSVRMAADGHPRAARVPELPGRLDDPGRRARRRGHARRGVLRPRR